MPAQDKFKCINKIRDKHNNITMYTIVNCRTGESINVSPDELKRGMSINMVVVENLKLTSDGRLIDASNNKEAAVTNTQKHNRNPLDNKDVQRFSELFRKICKAILGEGSTYSDRQDLVRCIEMDYCCDNLMKLNKRDRGTIQEIKEYIEENYKNAKEVYSFLRNYTVKNRLAVEIIITGNRAVGVDKDYYYNMLENYYYNMLDSAVRLNNYETLAELLTTTRPKTKTAFIINRAIEAKSVELREYLIYKKFVYIEHSDQSNTTWNDSNTMETVNLINYHDRGEDALINKIIKRTTHYRVPDIGSIEIENKIFVILPSVNNPYLELLGVVMTYSQVQEYEAEYTGASVINFMRKKHTLRNVWDVQGIIKDIIKFRNGFTAKLKHDKQEIRLPDKLNGEPYQSASEHEEEIDDTKNENSIETQNVKDKHEENSVDTQSIDIQSVDTQNMDTQSIDTQSVDTQSVDTQAENNTNIETQNVKAQSKGKKLGGIIGLFNRFKR